jgi:hypothetical protein
VISVFYPKIFEFFFSFSLSFLIFVPYNYSSY